MVGCRWSVVSTPSCVVIGGPSPIGLAGRTDPFGLESPFPAAGGGPSGPAATACGQGPFQQGRETLGGQGPVAGLGAGLAAVDAQQALAGQAATDANKQVTGGALGSAVRVLVFASDNVNEIHSGDLAQIRFRRVAGADATVSIRVDRPFFAPADAMTGVLLEEPFEL